jgi:CubicO group peptidase (beta-lactamase class C family)
MQQVQRAWPTVRARATGEGDDAMPERIDGGGYGFGLFVIHDDRFGHFVHHSGGLPGYGSNMRWLPGRHIGVIALGNVTYAPMSLLTRRMLEILDDHRLVTAATPAASPALIEAATRLAQLLSDWNDSDAAELFADNVALDESLSRRARRAAEQVSLHGPLRFTEVEATTPTRGKATLEHADGTRVKIELELSPLVPPRLQFYEVAAG